MRLSTREIQNIISLAHVEKADKRIRAYLEVLYMGRDEIEDNVDFLNRAYHSFFSHYFAKFAGKHKAECVMQAYAEALSGLRSGLSIKDAVELGHKAGSRFYMQLMKESSGGGLVDEYL